MEAAPSQSFPVEQSQSRALAVEGQEPWGRSRLVFPVPAAPLKSRVLLELLEAWAQLGVVAVQQRSLAAVGERLDDATVPRAL
jgi:hypothetical protein